MTAKRKQALLIAGSIFLALCSIGFSLDGTAFLWFWQKYPVIPVLLLLFVFFAIRYWLKLEIEKQRQDILAAYTRNNGTTTDQTNFRDLLSPREMEVMELINSGSSNKEIAATLFISLSTVKTHINNIYKILEVKNRREAIGKLNEK